MGWYADYLRRRGFGHYLDTPGMPVPHSGRRYRFGRRKLRPKKMQPYGRPRKGGGESHR